MSVYTSEPEQRRWELDSPSTTTFHWDYDDGRDQLLRLYDKGTRKQWIGADRLDWARDVDPENPLGVTDEFIPLFGSPVWDRMTEREKGHARHHMVSWQFSQFMHGEQGALICTAKIVQTVPDIDSKFYAATQVVDEARHVEVYSRYLYEKLELAYPLNPNLQSLLDDAIADSRWDMTYLAMQVLIEGLALAAFGLIRTNAQEPLAKALNAYVMQDEARHVTFGRLALRDYYPHLSDAERDEREEFCVDACYRMRDRFLAEEVWATLGLNVDECLEYVTNSESQQQFRGFLFARIVPTLRDIGLWGPRIRGAFEDMGVLGFADTDLDAAMKEDDQIAEQLDAERRDHFDSVVSASGA
jgi:P-aminobenzoate N-oxygenase AurF